MNLRLQNILLFLAYCVSLAFLFLHHEHWRDEIHSFNIALSSDSISALWHNCDYEGHPIAWYFLLYLGTFITKDLLIQSLIHLFFSVGVSYLIIFSSPFKFYFKLLLLFGYFFLYEYGLLERNYMPAIFFLFLGIHFFLAQKEKAAYLLVLLAGLFNIHAWILGLLLYAYFFFSNKKTWKQWLVHTLIIICYVIFFYIDIKPNAKDADLLYVFDGSLQQLHGQFLSFSEGILKARRILEKTGLNNIWFAGVSFALLLLIPFFVFKKERNIAILWFLFGMGLFLFWYHFLTPQIRHSGHVWIALIICSWLFLYKTKATSYSIYFLLIPIAFFHLFLSARIIVQDIKYPFSQIENVADYLKKNKFENAALVGYIDYCAEPIATLLNRKIFYPQCPQCDKFIQWRNSHNIAFTNEQLIQFCDSISKQENKDVLLISSVPIPTLAKKKVASFFNEATRENENYFLYLVNKL